MRFRWNGMLFACRTDRKIYILLRFWYVGRPPNSNNVSNILKVKKKNYLTLEAPASQSAYASVLYYSLSPKTVLTYDEHPGGPFIVLFSSCSLYNTVGFNNHYSNIRYVSARFVCAIIIKNHFTTLYFMRYTHAHTPESIHNKFVWRKKVFLFRCVCRT